MVLPRRAGERNVVRTVARAPLALDYRVAFVQTTAVGNRTTPRALIVFYRHQVSDLGNEGHGLRGMTWHRNGVSRSCPAAIAPVLTATFRRAYEPPAGEIGWIEILEYEM
jgi:hypothetical protein